MRMRVIVNSSAGTAIAMSREQLAAAIEQPLTAAGHEVAFEVVDARRAPGRHRAGRDRDFDALIIGGGDGSVRSAAVKLSWDQTKRWALFRSGR